MRTVLAIILTYSLVIGVFGVFICPHCTLRAEEFVMMRVDASAERAYLYGKRHFDAHEPDLYDIPLALSYFEHAYTLDREMPLVRHELARIAFLQDDMPRALEYINGEIAENPEPSPASYYVRGLIKAFTEDYAGAAEEYEIYFKIAPANWAAINDYAWVLLKSDLPEGALAALEWGLSEWPDNAWLLNNKVTALYELGRFEEARETAKRAQESAVKVTEADWLNAYPGNDPLVAGQGLASFRAAVQENAAKVAIAANVRE